MSRAVQLVLLSVVILTCLQTGVAHDIDVDGKSLLWQQYMLCCCVCVVASMISAAVHEILLPTMKEIKNDLNSVKNDLSSLNKTVSDLSGDLEDYKQQTASELEQNLQNFFGYIIPIHSCGGTGGWRRVVYLNFTDPNTPCPSGWRLTSHSKRTCGRVSTGRLTCDSVTFPVSGGDYTRVCGRIIAYQDESTGAFEPYDDGAVTTIEGSYVAGISLTHGSPRQHIWTFASGHSEFEVINWVCPCDATIDISIPPFVGGDYFCESGRNSAGPNMFFADDPLWDGDGCTATSTCCSFNNPPYFTKQLPSPTTDDIEARLCNDYTYEDTPIELIELYVQ